MGGSFGQAFDSSFAESTVDGVFLKIGELFHGAVQGREIYIFGSTVDVVHLPFIQGEPNPSLGERLGAVDAAFYIGTVVHKVKTTFGDSGVLPTQGSIDPDHFPG